MNCRKLLWALFWLIALVIAQDDQEYTDYDDEYYDYEDDEYYEQKIEQGSGDYEENYSYEDYQV